MLWLKEWVWPQEPARLIERTPQELRDELRHGLALSRQRADAAEALWSSGREAEGLRLAVEALRATLEVATKLPDRVDGSADGAVAGDGPAWSTKLRVHGLSERQVEVVQESADKLDQSVPELDDDVKSEHSGKFRGLLRARDETEKPIASYAMTTGDLRRLRVSRVAGVSFGVLVLLGGAYFALRTPHRVDADASSYYHRTKQFEPSNVFDGNEWSEWLLENKMAGWLEGRLSPPRDISVIRLLNSHNQWHNDRATREYQVKLYRDGKLLITVDGEFAKLLAKPKWAEHTVRVTGVDRIRVEVLSYHMAGGGLAEIDWR
jgi:hypothetical protein